jgi:hypothetical protein
MMLAQAADSDIQATTGRFNPSLGKQDSNRSGTAIQKLKEQGESSSSNYLENLASISMTHEAKILLDMLPHVYDRPGRIVRLLGDDPKDEREVILHQPFMKGPEGRPVPIAPPPAGLAMMGQPSPTMPSQGPGIPTQPQTKPPEIERYDLGQQGDYMVAVAIGTSFASQKDANGAILSGLMESAPQLTPILADIYAEQLDGPMADRIVKRIQKMNPQLSDDENAPPPVPPEVQQQMAQMQQQIQQMTAALQQAQQEAAMAQAKVQAQVQMKQMELDSRERIAAAQIQADITKAQAQMTSKESIAGLDAETKRSGQEAAQLHESRLLHQETEADRVAEQDKAALGIGPLYKPSPATFVAPETQNW